MVLPFVQLTGLKLSCWSLPCFILSSNLKEVLEVRLEIQVKNTVRHTYSCYCKKTFVHLKNVKQNDTEDAQHYASNDIDSHLKVGVWTLLSLFITSSTKSKYHKQIIALVSETEHSLSIRIIKNRTQLKYWDHKKQNTA